MTTTTVKHSSGQAAIDFPTASLVRVHTWWTILRISLEERLVYRGDFMLGTLMRFLPTITQIFLWYAVFSARDRQPITGYTYNDMIAYLLLTMIGRAFSSMPGLASGIGRDIRDGTIKKYLIQPVDMIGFLLLQRMAHKLVYYTVATLPFALVFYLCRGFFEAGWPDPATFCRLSRVARHGVLARVLSGSGDRHDGVLVSGSQFAVVHLHADFVFPFGADVPALDAGSIRGFRHRPKLGRRRSRDAAAIPGLFPGCRVPRQSSGNAAHGGLAIEFAWIVFFIILCRVGFRRGVRRYSAFGG